MSAWDMKRSKYDVPAGFEEVGFLDLNERRSQAFKDNERWFPLKQHDLVHHALGLCTESGEAGDVVKKFDRGTLSYEEMREKLGSELADVLVYVFSCAAIADIDLEATYDAKRRFNEERFGKKVSE